MTENISEYRMSETQRVLKVLRALVISLKPPTYLKGILEDYIDVESEELPYARLGFKSAVDFLENCPDFTLKRSGSDILISLRTLGKSAHIAKFVRHQGSSRRGSNKHKSDILQSKRSRVTSKGRPKNSHSSKVSYSKSSQISATNKYQTGNEGNTSPPRGLLYTRMTNPQPMRPILGANISNTNNNSSVHYNGTSTDYNHTQNDIETQNNGAVNGFIPQSTISRTLQPTLTRESSMPESSGNNEISKIQELQKYCRDYNHEEPIYKIYKSNYPCPMYSCSVKIEDTTFSVYPNEYPTEWEAKDASAQLALSKLRKQSTNTEQSATPCPYDNETILQKLYEALLMRPHGIVLNNLTEWFESTFNFSLPEDCIEQIKNSDLFDTEEILNDKIILYANSDDEVSMPEANNNAQQQYSMQEETRLESLAEVRDSILPKLKLPWSESLWDIHVTYVETPVIIWGRILGENYNSALNVLLEQYDREMQGDTNRYRISMPVVCQDIYLTRIDDVWTRLRVDEILPNQKEVYAYFLDIGDSAWISSEELYMCPTYLLQIAAQATPFTVYGMEAFEDHPAAMEHTIDLLYNKDVLGKVMFHTNYSEGEDLLENEKVILNLYQQSINEMSLNQMISKLINEDILNTTPHLEENSIEHAAITHICTNGDLYIQVLGKELDYLKSSMKRTIEEKLVENVHRIKSKHELDNYKTFLVNDSKSVFDNEQWFRAILTTTACHEEDSVNVFYVDYGLVKTVKLTQIYRLESMNFTLFQYPPQVILVRLDKVPPINSNMLEQIRLLLPINKEVMVKLIRVDKVPMVKIYIRLENSGALCTINDTIIVEHELNQRNNIHNDTTSTAGHSTTGSTSSSISSSESIPQVQESMQRLNINNYQAQTVATIHQDSLPVIPALDHLPGPGGYLEVRVTFAANPTSFMVQAYNYYAEYRDMMLSMQTYYEQLQEILPCEAITIGQCYTIRHTDNYYHRVIVQKKLGSIFTVLLCDFGDVTTVNHTQLRTLPAEYRKLPRLALCASLHGIQPIGNQWTRMDCQYYRQLTVGKKFVASIMRYDTNATVETSYCPFISVHLIDTSTDDDILLHNMLIEENMAKIC